MITYAVILAFLGLIAKAFKEQTVKNVNRKAYQMTALHGSLLSEHTSSSADHRIAYTGEVSGFNGGSVCGDGITDRKILKKVIFEANKGTAVEGLELQVGICGSQFSTLYLGNTQNKSNGVLNKITTYSQELYAGNYSLIIMNKNTNAMANDGNLTDDQITVKIDGFAIGELPFTRSGSEQTYNLIVNPD
jgi:hypothetical protein